MNSIDELTEVGYDYSPLYNDYDEMIEGMKILTEDDQFLDNYFSVNPVSVTFLNIKTKSLFVPSNVNIFNPEGGSISGSTSNTGDYSSDKRLSKGFSYTMNTYALESVRENCPNSYKKAAEDCMPSHRKVESY